jgi:PPM family protein phosphatase
VSLAIVESAADTDVGRQRSSNEDSYLEAAPFFAVADGMGGARAGEVASRIAVEAFGDERDESASPERQLAEIARTANTRIYALAQEDESRAGMGTTLSAVMVADGDVAIGHVGDSRVYRFRDGELERLTRDHSLVDELVRQGKLTPEEAEVHPQRSIITRALGPEPDVEVETLTYPGRDGDVYLLCSDGLTGMVPEQRVAETLRASSSLEAAVKQLLDAANEGGGRDNITVVLFRLGSAESEPATGEDQATLTGRERVGAAAEQELRARRRAPSVEDADAAARPRAAPRPRLPSFPTGRRRVATALVLAILVGAVTVGFYVGSRQFYFVGTDGTGLVTLYRGLPYELPLGVRLFQTEYTTTVPARAVVRLGRKCVLTDHKLGTRADRADLIRQVEQGRLTRGSGSEC